MIADNMVSVPTFSARMVKLPRRFIVPAYTFAPGAFGTASGSPVIMLSSTKDVPETTAPSAGILPPGATVTSSPGRISGRLGWMPIRARTDAVVACFARSSSKRPNKMNATIIAADSK